MDIDLARRLLVEGDKNVELPAAPEAIKRELGPALDLVRRAERQCAVGSHADYFRTSCERYACYVALAKVYLRQRQESLTLGMRQGTLPS